MPLFSIVIPLYNKRRYIRRAVESALRQTCRDFELIVVDDGSTDDSGDIVTRIADPRVRLIRQTNGGEGAARNTGIRQAAGELVAFLDADDEWKPRFLSSMEALHALYPSAGILASGYRRCFSRAHAFDQEVTIARPHCLITNYFQVALFGPLLTSSSVVVPRRVLECVGGFLEGEPNGPDRELWLRIALEYPIACSSEILAVYHSEAEGRVCDRRPAQSPYPLAARTLDTVLRNGVVPRDLREDAHRYADLLKLQYAYWCLDLGDIEGAVRLLSTRRVAAPLLRLGIALLPVRVLLALRRKPVNLWSWIRQPTWAGRILGSGVRRRGPYLVTRLVSQPPMPDAGATFTTAAVQD